VEKQKAIDVNINEQPMNSFSCACGSVFFLTKLNLSQMKSTRNIDLKDTCSWLEKVVGRCFIFHSQEKNDKMLMLL
jgi:hypothetical protein